MDLTVHGKQLDVGDALRTHVSEKLEDLSEKYFNHATFATVTFSREGHGHPQTRAHIQIQLGKNIMVMADATEMDPYVSFDAAAEKVSKQLRRYKRKLRDHHEREAKVKDPETEIIKARKYTLAVEPEVLEQDNQEPEDDVPQGDDPVIIAEIDSDIETLSVSEAVMRLDLSGYPAMMFRNAKSQQINMVYRRPDGNIGWVDPE